MVRHEPVYGYLPTSMGPILYKNQHQNLGSILPKTHAQFELG